MQTILDRLPTLEQLLYAGLAFLIPYGIYKINQKLHEAGDPPWKKEQQETQEN